MKKKLPNYEVSPRLKNWKLTTVVMDTLWGGTLFVLVKFLYHKLRQIV